MIHNWAKTGIWDNGEILIPCLEPNCAWGKRGRTINEMRESPDEFSMSPNGIDLDIEDDPEGGVAKIVCREIEEIYDTGVLDLKPNDVVIDIGAHVGIVSVYLAKRFPGIKVYAFEPVPANFERLKRNVKANGVENEVLVSPFAVTGNGKPVRLRVDMSVNSGSGTMYEGRGKAYTAKSARLLEIFAKCQIERCALMKMDCEGAEYDILEKDGYLLERVDNFVGEFHTSVNFTAAGKEPDKLIDLCQQYIPSGHLYVTVSRMG